MKQRQSRGAAEMPRGFQTKKLEAEVILCCGLNFPKKEKLFSEGLAGEAGVQEQQSM